MNSSRVPIRITLDGRAMPGVTRFASVGAHVLVITTTLPDPTYPVTVTSTYVGQRRNNTHATHLVLRPHDPVGSLDTRIHPADELPVAADERRGCLYDHLHQLQEALSAGDHLVGIDVLDQAAELIDS